MNLGRGNAEISENLKNLQKSRKKAIKTAFYIKNCTFLDILIKITKNQKNMKAPPKFHAGPEVFEQKNFRGQNVHHLPTVVNFVSKKIKSSKKMQILTKFSITLKYR